MRNDGKQEVADHSDRGSDAYGCGLARNIVGARAKAQYDSRSRDSLAAGFGRTRPNVASLLGLGSDQAGQDAGGLVLALFYGLLL